MKLVTLIKIYFNETFSNVRVGRHFPDNFAVKCGLQQGDCIGAVLQLELRICYWQGPGKLGGTQNMLNISALIK
jgi:hypothetical protein